MQKEEWFRQHAGRYHLVKFVIGGNDCSEAYVNGWKDKNLYMLFEITEETKDHLMVYELVEE